MVRPSRTSDEDDPLVLKSRLMEGSLKVLFSHDFSSIIIYDCGLSMLCCLLSQVDIGYLLRVVSIHTFPAPLSLKHASGRFLVKGQACDLCNAALCVIFSLKLPKLPSFIIPVACGCVIFG
jgi:hypothetical protein